MEEKLWSFTLNFTASVSNIFYVLIYHPEQKKIQDRIRTGKTIIFIFSCIKVYEKKQEHGYKAKENCVSRVSMQKQ